MSERPDYALIHQIEQEIWGEQLTAPVHRPAGRRTRIVPLKPQQVLHGDRFYAWAIPAVFSLVFAVLLLAILLQLGVK